MGKPAKYWPWEDYDGIHLSDYEQEGIGPCYLTPCADLEALVRAYAHACGCAGGDLFDSFRAFLAERNLEVE